MVLGPFDMLIRKWLSKRRQLGQQVDAEATALLAREGAAGYYTARRRCLVADEQNEIDMAEFWNKVRLRIAERADLAPYRRKTGLPKFDALFGRRTRALPS